MRKLMMTLRQQFPTLKGMPCSADSSRNAKNGTTSFWMDGVCIVAAVIMALGFQSCGGDDDSSGNDDKKPSVGDNRILEGTKWTTRSFDFDIDDNLTWGYYFTDITNIYFYSNTEGVFYYSRKTNDSDEGRSRDTQVCFFTYKVDREESMVHLEPITYECFGFAFYLDLSGNNIVYANEPMTKGSISASDRSWLDKITGTTGQCKWYYDMRHTLSISGNGDMGDYTSYAKTPWAIRNAEYNDIYIGPGVTNIGNRAFAYPSLGYVELYNCELKRIGEGAFMGSAIGEMNLYYATAIGKEAFAGCKNYKAKPDECLEEIGSYAFSDCKDVDLHYTKNLRIIDDFACAGSNVSRFGKAESLEKIGNGAVFLDNKITVVTLPVIKELGSMAVVGTKLDEIHIGKSLSHVNGTPFSGAATGKFYINQSIPLNLSSNIVENANKWTLYVPKGSASKYKQAAYWKNFKSIMESDLLDDESEGDDTPDDDGDGVASNIMADAKALSAVLSGKIITAATNKYKSFDLQYGTDINFGTSRTITDLSYPDFSVTIKALEPNTTYYYRIRCKESSTSYARDSKTYSFETKSPQVPSSCSYTINGVTYQMIKVTGLSTGDFYIMQTELAPSSSFEIDGYKTNSLDVNGDNIIIKAEFSKFLYELRYITDIEFRLPTKSEWIYAAQGGQSSISYKYSGSNNLDEVGWYKGNSTGLHKPALLKPNELGLYDMSGNYNELVHTSGDECDVDGNIYGGWYGSDASKCTPNSYISQPSGGKIPGSSKSNKNAVECSHTAVRLVYSAK